MPPSRSRLRLTQAYLDKCNDLETSAWLRALPVYLQELVLSSLEKEGGVAVRLPQLQLRERSEICHLLRSKISVQNPYAQARPIQTS